jgi:tetratricopeptide (TPR) repeat protein
MWRAPQSVFAKEKPDLQPITLEGCRQWQAQWILPGELDVDVYLALLDKVGRCRGARVACVTALAETARGRSDAGLDGFRTAAKINPRDALLVQMSEALELEARRRIKIGDFKGGAKCYENLLSFSFETAQAHYGLAYCLRANGDNEASYLHFVRAVAAAPEQNGYRMELAQVALMIGEFAEADRQYQEVLKREANNPETLFRYAMGLVWKERPDKNMAQALKLAERACVLTKWGNTEYAYGLADLYMDAGRVLEGMGLKRRIKEGFKTEVVPAP